MNDSTAYGASWHAANAVEAPLRPPLKFEQDVDVCVIGAGLAGLTAALEVARRGWSVVVLEARRIAWNASGRSAGFVLPGFVADVQDLIEKIGADHAKQLWQLSEMGADYVRQTIRDTGMPGADLQENGWLHVSRTGNDGQLAAYADFLSGELGTAAEFWPAERVRTMLRSTQYFGGLHLPGGFAINPLNYALGLAAAASAAGAQIYEDTPAIEIDPAGVRKRIVTPSARVRAGHVVLAGNVHIGGLMPDLAGTLVPVWAYTIVTEPLGERLREAIRFRGMVTDNELGDSDHRIVGGDRLLWADRCTVWDGNPRRHARALLADIGRTYPQLGKVEAEYAWSGVMGTTVHGMPQIGEMLPGVWLLSGFSGHGINTTAMGGNLVARGIVEGAPTWQFFQPFELVWAGGRLGRAAVQTYYWTQRASEHARAWLTHKRAPVQQLPEIEPPPAPDPVQEREPAAAEAEAPAAAPAKPRKRKPRRKPKAQRLPDAAEA